MLIRSIGTAKLSPERYVEENFMRYQDAFADGIAEGESRYSKGTLRFKDDMPKQLQIGIFGHNRAEGVVKAWNQSIGIPEGPGQLIVMNRWAYDPSESGMIARPDMLIDLGPNRSNQVLRYVMDGKSSLTEAMNSHLQFSRVSNWLGTSAIKAATPQGTWNWTQSVKRGR